LKKKKGTQTVEGKAWSATENVGRPSSTVVPFRLGGGGGERGGTTAERKEPSFAKKGNERVRSVFGGKKEGVRPRNQEVHRTLWRRNGQPSKRKKRKISFHRREGGGGARDVPSWKGGSPDDWVFQHKNGPGK